MPSRPACAAILLFWAYAAGGLFRRDVLPDLWTTPPPDLRTVAGAGDDARPTRWDLSVAEDASLRNLRPIGHAVTQTTRAADGGIALLSMVNFDSGSLLKSTQFAPKSGDARGDEHLTISNRCEIDPSGNLVRLHAEIRSADELLMTVEGRVEGRSLKVKTRGPIPMLNLEREFPYEARGLIQNAVGPIDRLPGLQVGQRWETRVVNPITGWVDAVKTEVVGKHLLTWDGDEVATLEVVQNLSPFMARTWVRRDGLVLRQEVPLPFVRLILDRVPDPSGRGQAGVQAP